MGKIIEALSGYKTYITAVAAGIDAFGVSMQWWEENHLRNIVEGVLMVVFLRTGIEKSGPKA